MLQIELAAQSNGAHRNQCSADNTPILEGFARVADDVDISQVPNISFVLLTVTDGVITSVADDTISREAWESLPVTVPVDETALLKGRVSALTQSNQMLEECIVEMASIVYA